MEGFARGATPPKAVPAVADAFDSLGMRFLRGTPKFGASNAWAVHGNFTTTGSAVLCNDPHLRLDNPSLWMLMRLTAAADDLNVAGGTFAGAPGVRKTYG